MAGPGGLRPGMTVGPGGPVGGSEPQHKRPLERVTRIGGRSVTADPRQSAAWRHERARAIAATTGQKVRDVEQSTEFRWAVTTTQRMWMAEYYSQRDARHFNAAQRYQRVLDNPASTRADLDTARAQYRQAIYEGAHTKKEQELASNRYRVPLTRARYNELRKRNLANNEENYGPNSEYAKALVMLKLRPATAYWVVGDTP